MRCLKREKIQTFIDKELSPKKRRKVDRHLSQCTACLDTLKSVKEEITFVNAKLDSLNPASIPHLEKEVLIQSNVYKKGQSFFLRFLFSKVRVPVPALVFLACVILALTAMLFSEYNRSAELGFVRIKRTDSDSLNIHYKDSVHSVSLDLDLDKFRPIEKPNIFVISQEER
ncbi:zf-HC2 domain-containing protein [Acidobacteriota bacterium]